MAARLKRTICAIILVCFVSACTKTVRVPETEFAQLTPKERTYLDVTTSDARYRVSRFAVNDSTLVVEAVQTGTNTYPARNTNFDKPPYFPYPLPLSSIESVTESKRPHDVSGVFIAVGMVGGFFLALAWVLSNVGDLHAD